MYTNFCPMRKRKCSCTPLSPLKGVGDSSAYGWLKQLFLRVFSSPFRGAGGCLLAVFLSCCSGHAAGGGNELKCRVMEEEGGYGYVVLHGADTLIYQPFVPVVSGRLPFATKAEALAVGRLVCRKLVEGQSPRLSRKEVEACLTDTGICAVRQ